MTSGTVLMPYVPCNVMFRFIKRECTLYVQTVGVLVRMTPDENCCVLGYYAASSGDFLPMFRDNLLVPSSGVLIFGL